METLSMFGYCNLDVQMTFSLDLSNLDIFQYLDV